MRRTPQIRFRPDTVLSSALRIEEILRDIGDTDGGDTDATPASSDEPSAE